MKKALLIGLFLCFSQGYAQEIIGKSYITNVNIKVEYELDSMKKYMVSKGVKFYVENIDEADAIITFWEFDEELNFPDGLRSTAKDSINIILNKESKDLKKEDISAKLDLGYLNIGMWSNHIKFRMKLKDLNDKTTEYHGKSNNFTFGVMTLPIKVRFGNNKERFFNYEENLNLGFTFGYKRKIASRVEQSHNILGGIGVSSVTFNEENNPNGSSEEENDSVEASTEDTAAALTVNFGYLYQYQSFQVGLFLGKDFIPGGSGRSWDFQGKTWLGIAIGVSLFSNDTNKEEPGTNK